MIDSNTIDSLIGVDVIDRSDRKVGTVGQVYVDSDTNRPTWVTINTGLFGLSESFAPLDQADFTGGVLRVAFEKAFVKDAPRIDNDGALDSADEDALYRYYGLGQAGAGARSGDDRIDRADRNDGEGFLGNDREDRDRSSGGDGVLGNGERTPGRDGILASDGDTGLLGNDPATTRDRDRVSGATGVGQEDVAAYQDLHTEGYEGAGHDTSGPNTDDAMTRSEERLHVGTEQVGAGRARLRKHIVTENQTVTVPVSREEVRLEREPITDANRGQARSGRDLSEEEHEVQLTEERVVVNKETVPVERVRLGTETVTDEQQVSEDVRREEIDFDESEVDRKRRQGRDDRN
ncbi:DUF2382 domain-containing protein [Cryobacterium melibiosiphilum]|uniref:DUF2382 domain-containing protein n=1 Tax=Cryobacterium melibiosiphilum TaxID=995039 RepID=A0A3A5MHX2_9MICO|nr:PRC and DUF2382 domain-containing protein [Cryobacterium melibiosiphilum]RJT89747.1 DUF2382 domain-containing protein [Cryobacterium melibiosiphilum]